MVDDFDLAILAVKEYERAKRMTKINREFNDHLLGSIYWIIKYCEKNHLPLPKKEQLKDMISKCDIFLDDLDLSYQPTGNSDKSTDNGTAPN